MSEQERKSFIASGELISITEAAEFTPYSAEYLSLRARTGHLKATKIARNWVTTRAAVLSYLRTQKQKHSQSKNSQNNCRTQLSSVSQSSVVQPEYSTSSSGPFGQPQVAHMGMNQVHIIQSPVDQNTVNQSSVSEKNLNQGNVKQSLVEHEVTDQEVQEKSDESTEVQS